ncbi:SMI1/KNR4 family protein [Pedobacter cryoconitis]|uniref:SMI1/KNR4 family protein SUKH-1 n=1 Tax=Pedobacter cryoconitis TaxID=188932 RepID=A0A327SA55_9SPHI|nr:SMI1/KNR4 family protein [Pedobacter cryoconitis]RAJ22657.1 SMI1/KNR4 family protein SUKH-1 [Pedobacter cryoconitis]
MLEINNKEDIIIPFEKIGDSDWTIKTSKIIEAFADTWEEEHRTPISAGEITALETKLGTTLPKGLSLFYQTFGLANIGEELQDLDQMEWMKDIWAKNPQDGPDFTDQDNEVLPYLVTFSNYIGNGNIFCFHSETKEIYLFDHDSTIYINRIFNTADDYIKGCLIFAQAELYGEDTDQEDADEWSEEIAEQLFGEDTIKQWKY